MLRVKERTPFPFNVFILGLAFKSIKEFGDVSSILKEYILAMNFSNEMGESSQKQKII
jgi:hypothetical protein